MFFTQNMVWPNVNPAKVIPIGEKRFYYDNILGPTTDDTFYQLVAGTNFIGSIVIFTFYHEVMSNLANLNSAIIVDRLDVNGPSSVTANRQSLAVAGSGFDDVNFVLTPVGDADNTINFIAHNATNQNVHFSIQQSILTLHAPPAIPPP